MSDVHDCMPHHPLTLSIVLLHNAAFLVACFASGARTDSYHVFLYSLTPTPVTTSLHFG